MLLDRGRRSADAIRSRAIALVALMAALAADGTASEPGDGPEVTTPAGAPVALIPALSLAKRWLARARCREMFRQFRDASGRTLQDVLDERGETAVEHLAFIRFVGDPDGVRCGDYGVLATTTVGGSEVRVCGARFAALARRDFTELAVVVLHEELHSLGLGENPPTSRQISSLVETSCR